MSRRRKGNGTLKNFVAHSRELRESAAWRALPDNARRVLDRLELEHMRHGGAANGRLVCTYYRFREGGSSSELHCAGASAVRCPWLPRDHTARRAIHLRCPPAVLVSANLRPRPRRAGCRHR